MVAPDDWTGSYCIVSSDKGKIMTNTPGSKPTYLEAADIEIDSGSVRDPEWVYTLTAAGDGTYYVRDAAGPLRRSHSVHIHQFFLLAAAFLRLRKTRLLKERSFA